MHPGSFQLHRRLLPHRNLAGCFWVPQTHAAITSVFATNCTISRQCTCVQDTWTFGTLMEFTLHFAFLLLKQLVSEDHYYKDLQRQCAFRRLESLVYPRGSERWKRHLHLHGCGDQERGQVTSSEMYRHSVVRRWMKMIKSYQICSIFPTSIVDHNHFFERHTSNLFVVSYVATDNGWWTAGIPGVHVPWQQHVEFLVNQLLVLRLFS